MNDSKYLLQLVQTRVLLGYKRHIIPKSDSPLLGIDPLVSSIQDLLIPGVGGELVNDIEIWKNVLQDKIVVGKLISIRDVGEVLLDLFAPFLGPSVLQQNRSVLCHHVKNQGYLQMPLREHHIPL